MFKLIGFVVIAYFAIKYVIPFLVLSAMVFFG